MQRPSELPFISIILELELYFSPLKTTAKRRPELRRLFTSYSICYAQYLLVDLYIWLPLGVKLHISLLPVTVLFKHFLIF